MFVSHSLHDFVVFLQVFGRTIICRDLDVATRVARTDGLDCITLEGSMTLCVLRHLSNLECLFRSFEL